MVFDHVRGGLSMISLLGEGRPPARFVLLCSTVRSSLPPQGTIHPICRTDGEVNVEEPLNQPTYGLYYVKLI